MRAQSEGTGSDDRRIGVGDLAGEDLGSCACLCQGHRAAIRAARANTETADYTRVGISFVGRDVQREARDTRHRGRFSVVGTCRGGMDACKISATLQST